MHEVACVQVDQRAEQASTEVRSVLDLERTIATLLTRAQRLAGHERAQERHATVGQRDRLHQRGQAGDVQPRPGTELVRERLALLRVLEQSRREDGELHGHAGLLVQDFIGLGHAGLATRGDELVAAQEDLAGNEVEEADREGHGK